MNQLSVALYARYSTDRQDARSIDDQLRRCRVFARDRGYEVVAEFQDAAKSGASLHRADLQRLLALARTNEGPRFRALLVDDLSRLSRDLGDTWSLVFEHLAAAEVRVIDCTTGMASDGAGARLTFGAMALVNDTFLQLVKTETHRGLEGRALAGFHTGGHCYGYDTRPEESPQNPEKPRAVIYVNQDEAKVVLRIFSDAAKGLGVGTIAQALNREGITAPYDELGYKKAATGKGWGASQIHQVLHNERYVGKLIWNRRKWYRDPLTKRRRFKERPRSEWVVREDETLRIVPQPLWEAVQKPKPGAGKRGRPAGSSSIVKHPHLLTGLLKCGACGGSLSVTGSKRLGCATNHNKGDAACTNRRAISERLLDETVLKSIVNYVASDDFETWVENAIRRQQRSMSEEPDEKAELEAQIRTQQTKVEKVATTLLTIGVSDTLTQMLKNEEERLRNLRFRLATLVPLKAVSQAVNLDVPRVVAAMQDIRRLASESPIEARDAIRRVVEKAVLNLREGNDGEPTYEVSITLSSDLATLSGGRSADKTSCGGRI